MTVCVISHGEAADLVVRYHYLRRRPPISFSFGLIHNGVIKGVVTLGVPASREMLTGALPSDPSLVLELNRIWVADDMPRNTASWFVSRALALLPGGRLILSYADTSQNHIGYLYRSLNFYYGGWTDMKRKLPRWDRKTATGKHSRDASRNGWVEKVRRKPKVRYWTVTGTKRDKRRLERQCTLLKLDWKTLPPPLEHQQVGLPQKNPARGLKSARLAFNCRISFNNAKV
jgi:hypothetical protein